MKGGDVKLRFVRLGEREFLLFSLRVDRVEFPPTALRRAERAFRVAAEAPDHGTPTHPDEKPIEVDEIEPVENAVEEGVEPIKPPTPPPIKKVKPPEVSVIPHKPPPDEWRLVVHPPTPMRTQKPSKRRVSGALIVLLVLAAAFAALHFSGVLPLSKLIKRWTKPPLRQPTPEQNRDAQPFREAFKLHLGRMLAARPKGAVTVATNINNFSHTLGGLALRLSVPANWRLERQETGVTVDGGAVKAVVFVVRLTEDVEMNAVGKVVESCLKESLRRVKVSPAHKGFLCTAKRKGDFLWMRIWVEKRWVVTVMARGSFECADIWLAPLERMVTVVGEKR
ncbi:MAG: hypothetical protein DRP63_06285 [Planctomycetota bacterium]|nr:MAG: hypothetical protein DRP63_06285 [Planctomycetota bacterium]